jgi:hypothetical protein
MIKKFESETQRDVRLAQEQILADGVTLGGKPIQNIRGQICVIGDKRNIVERNKFNYYDAFIVLINPIQCPETIKTNEDTMLIDFKPETVQKYNIKHPKIRVLKINHRFVVAERNGIWGYGARTSDARAYLAIALFDLIQQYDDASVDKATMVTGKISNSR